MKHTTYKKGYCDYTVTHTKQNKILKSISRFQLCLNASCHVTAADSAEEETNMAVCIAVIAKEVANSIIIVSGLKYILVL